MIVDKAGGDYRRLFSEMFASTHGQKFPKEKYCFDYVYSVADDCFIEWSTKVPQYVPIPIGGGPGLCLRQL